MNIICSILLNGGFWMWNLFRILDILLFGVFLILTSEDSVFVYIFWIQFSSVTQLCLTLFDHMDCSTPVFPVHHQLPELAKTHIH